MESPKGKLVIIDPFPSKTVVARPVRIWLPPGYDPAHQYAVVYMHDGQMLFDSSITWNQRAWEVDDTISLLIERKVIPNLIVVGIDNSGIYRNSDYFPESALSLMQDSLRSRVIHAWLQDRPSGDAYLRFIVEELKPYIDSTYSTLTNPANTLIIGSSMGGLISLYAICRYPEVFGGAGCMSTHWPMLNPVSDEEELLRDVPAAFLSILPSILPDPASHIIYFDHGTLGLDSLYGPYQKKVDAIMMEKGFSPRQWATKVFANTGHSEEDWGRRFPGVLHFLLPG